eukprot:4752001-Pleurochrysis_carterae.AAC.3
MDSGLAVKRFSQSAVCRGERGGGDWSDCQSCHSTDTHAYRRTSPAVPALWRSLGHWIIVYTGPISASPWPQPRKNLIGKEITTTMTMSIINISYT